MGQKLRTTLRAERAERGWSQASLARAAGISRQSYAAIESGASVPSTEVALRLARALGTTVEALFALGDSPAATVSAELVGPRRPLATRVALMRVGGRLLARPAVPGRGTGAARADGLIRSVAGDRVEVELLDECAPRPSLVMLGGDPSFGILAESLARERGVELSWWPMGSTAALEALARGEAHVAGVHLLDAESGGYNGPWIERLLPFPVTRIGFAIRELALLLAESNPLGIHALEDLPRPEVRFLNREPGSGSRVLLDHSLTTRGVDGAAIPGYDTTAASGHFAVAEAVAAGAADCGIALTAAARAYGLGSLPLGEERYELVVPNHFLDHPAMEALLDHLRDRRFHAQVEALGHYDAAPMGLPV